MEHKLEVDSVQLAFNGRKILSDIYLKCETGKISGLLGRNGQGKSCLMKIAYGTLDCDKSVRIDRTVYPEAFKHPDLLRYLPQFNFIPPRLTLKRIFLDFGLDYSIFEARFPEFSSKYKLPVNILSGGERRIVEIYVIVKSDSLFSMLDEPFTHLSPVQIDSIKSFLLDEKRNKGIFITDHMYKHVLDLSDNLYLLTNGKTHLVKTMEEIETLGYARI